MDKMSTAYSWKESVAAALNLGKRDIQRDLALYRLLIEPFPDLIEALSKHPVAGNNRSQLKELTQLKDEGLRRKAIEALLADHEIGVQDAKIAAGIRPDGPAATPLPHMKFVNAVVGNMARLGAPKLKQHLPEIVRALGTDEVKRQMRDLLNKELGDD
jgi:hypothetical protein